ncbi:M48 family metalloprotease [Pseudodesulfovibrio sediminis]|uniref:Peptidase M48 n=1 Tax=Pseudodesulfovibrio sediminis TaxID=2810563 RepID=A0ABM7P538_9BACT|nr:M48 family metalloprotease [Pseudodesulfovibrio sediminis]BCS87993.1 peptidase M48 [Pseudodesulfovibrio sediminis]
MKRRHFLASLATVAPALLIPGLAQAFGITLGDFEIDTDTVVDALKSGKKIAAGFKDITPEQEYYIGRSVSAYILTKYKPLKHNKSRQYVNVMGQTLAMASDLPETFGGYHFLVLDSDEINALSAPGGFVFVTKGLLQCCTTEDAMAAVLAHEIGHVQRQHGLQAIQKSRVSDGVTTLALTGTSTFSGGTLKELTTTFDGTIKDITTTMIDSGYSRSFEEEADTDAVTIMQRVGYNPNYIVDMLSVMKSRIKPDGRGFARTHPSPDDRMKVVTQAIGPYCKPKPNMNRGMRFLRMTGGM